MLALTKIASPPLPVETTPLADFVTRLETAARQVDDLFRQLALAEKEQAAAAAELREFAEDGICPTCGGPLDADRLLAQAAAGLGGHAHG